MATTWPSLKEVRSVLRLQPDPTEDGIIQTALSAAVGYGIKKLGQTKTDNGDGTCTVTWTYPADSTDVPDAAHEACLLHASRLYRRRDSIDGTISWGDMGGVRVGGYDPDVERLYANDAPLVFG